MGEPEPAARKAADPLAAGRTHPEPETGDTTAGGKLGLPGATALVVGNIVGTGIFLLPASLAAIGTISFAVMAADHARRHRARRRLRQARRPQKNGIEVLTIRGSELGRGRGGPRCMSCRRRGTPDPRPVPAPSTPDHVPPPSP